MSIHIYKNPDALAGGLARWIASDISLVLKSEKRYSFVLSGGSTPKRLYEVLASQYHNQIDWEKVDFFFGDERYVPFDDDRNNGKMAYKELLIPLKIPAENVYRMNTEVTLAEGVKQYDQKLRNYFEKDKTHSFDFTLLGLGSNAHTLSLFPNSDIVFNSTDWVTIGENKEDGTQRITLMPALVNASRNIIFLFQGQEKADTFKEVLNEPFNPKKYPAQVIISQSGQLMWFTDEAAGSKVFEK